MLALMPQPKYSPNLGHMIAKTYIIENLRSLNALFVGSTSAKKGLLYSKLAIIEFCGWIEMSMDDIVKRCATRNLSLPKNRKAVQNDIIDKTYGFEYERHFRKMLTHVVGLKNVEQIERRSDPMKLQRLKSALGALKQSRDSLAHTYLKDTAITLDAPSVTKARFTDVYDGLVELERVLATLQL